MPEMVTKATIKPYVPKVALRFRTLVRYGAFRRSPRLSAAYLLHGRELDNFTYDIANLDELASFVARWCDISTGEAEHYIRELLDDAAFREALEQKLATRRDREPHMAYGRRLGWYAVTRARLPSLVVETGVHDGLGSAVFLRALERNAARGSPGKLLSFDVRRDVGWLIPDGLRDSHELVIGDSVKTMSDAVGGRRIGLFLHDSDHHYEYETAELEVALSIASDDAILISDNSASGMAMADFCGRHNLAFELFREQPVEHFYPGAGIGIARTRREAAPSHDRDRSSGGG